MADEETREETQERHSKETLEFERIQAELEKYGAIMQSCMEEAERTMQIWRGREERTASWDDKVFLAMMPAVSVALFEKVTGTIDLGKIMKMFMVQGTVQMAQTFLQDKMAKILADKKPDSQDEGVEP